MKAGAHHSVQGPGGVKEHVQEHAGTRVGQELQAEGVRATVRLPAALAVRKQRSRQSAER